MTTTQVSTTMPHPGTLRSVGEPAALRVPPRSTTRLVQMYDLDARITRRRSARRAASAASPARRWRSGGCRGRPHRCGHRRPVVVESRVEASPRSASAVRPRTHAFRLPRRRRAASRVARLRRDADRVKERHRAGRRRGRAQRFQRSPRSVVRRQIRRSPARSWVRQSAPTKYPSMGADHRARRAAGPGARGRAGEDAPDRSGFSGKCKPAPPAREPVTAAQMIDEVAVAIRFARRAPSSRRRWRCDSAHATCVHPSAGRWRVW